MNNDQPLKGFLRLNAIIGKDGLIPISKSSFYSGIQEKKFPSPLKLGGGRVSLWRVADIEAVIADPENCRFE